MHYIDKKADRFVQEFSFSGISSGSKKRTECRFQHHCNIFLDYVSDDSQTYTYMGGQTKQAWESERKDLLSSLCQKVRDFRDVPLEERGWDVDLV